MQAIISNDKFEEAKVNMELYKYWKIQRKEDQEWKDNKGKKHTKTTTRYETEPYGVPEKYTFEAYVAVDFALVSAKTKEILFVHSAIKTNDKEIDAYRGIVEEFYEKLNKKLKE